MFLERSVNRLPVCWGTQHILAPQAAVPLFDTIIPLAAVPTYSRLTTHNMLHMIASAAFSDGIGRLQSRDRQTFGHKEGVVSPNCQQLEAHCGLRQYGSPLAWVLNLVLMGWQPAHSITRMSCKHAAALCYMFLRPLALAYKDQVVLAGCEHV